MTLVTSLCVAGGSAIGAVGRFSIGQAIGRINRSPFPWETWLVNMLGTLLLGIFTQAFTHFHHDPDLWLLFGTGFCGAFTTFSTMSVETVKLFKTKFILGFIYLGSSLAVGLVLAWMTAWWF